MRRMSAPLLEEAGRDYPNAQLAARQIAQRYTSTRRFIQMTYVRFISKKWPRTCQNLARRAA